MIATSIYHYLIAFSFGFGAGVCVSALVSSFRYLQDIAGISAEIRSA